MTNRFSKQQLLGEMRILIIEDSAHDRAVLRTLLRNIGCEYGQITECESGRNAIRKLASMKVDIVFSDIHLGDMIGMKVFDFCKGCDLDAESMFVFISADITTDLVGALAKLGASDVLVKPLTEYHVRKVLDKKLTGLALKRIVEEETPQ